MRKSYSGNAIGGTPAEPTRPGHGFGDVRVADAKAMTEAKGPHLLDQRSGLGYYPYVPNGATLKSPSDRQHGSQFTIMAMKRIAAEFHAQEKIEVGIGDIALKSYQPFHHSHTRGTAVDIRAIRKDRRPVGVNFQSSSYDRDATQKLVDAIRREPNVARILFNDTSIEGVQPYIGHDDHLHIQFKN
jgi:hypothetical protein